MPDVAASKLMTDEELGAWLAFDRISGIGLGSQKIIAIAEHLGNLEFAWQANRDQLRFVPGLTLEVIDQFIAKRNEIDPETLLGSLRSKGILALPRTHPHYPTELKHIYDPPCVLYIQGQLSPTDLQHAVAVVGTRRPTAYGQRNAKDIARGLAESGVTIISGMAIGIDSFAHRAAIEGGGKTIAVLGCGVDVCYPSSNRPLYQLLASGAHGAVISEYFPETKPDTWRFPARNRIISGLSQAIVVVEAGETSGSLITANLGFDQGHAVYAVPGRIDSPMSIGTNALIAGHKAQLIRSYKDILFDKGWATTSSVGETPAIIELYGREREVHDLLSAEPIHFDVLCEKTGIPVGELSAALTMLELAGLVTRLAGDQFIRER